MSDKTSDAVKIIKARYYKKHKEELYEVIKQAHHEVCNGQFEAAQVMLFNALERFSVVEDEEKLKELTQ